MDYVEHGRYGSRPRITGLDPDPEDPDVYLHWNTGILNREARTLLEEWTRRSRVPERAAIPGTAIVADIDRQTPAAIAVTHYYDVARECRTCGRPFIFFAVEQKHWYEELGFPLEADCVNCYPCRKAAQALQRTRFRYETLVKHPDPSPDEAAELALARLELMAAGVFGARQIDRVRQFLNRFPDHPAADEVRDRLGALNVENPSGGRRIRGRRRDRS
ncbi:MAG: zinc-ribbon domain containing protein [Planctomycetes bacterium]|nr:zinc-ribbon domain containing protein [Planctomycetota bacterium]